MKNKTKIILTIITAIFFLIGLYGYLSLQDWLIGLSFSLLVLMVIGVVVYRVVKS